MKLKRGEIMEWIYLGYGISIIFVACFVCFIFGQESGMREMQKQIDDMAECLVKQNLQIAALKKSNMHTVEQIMTKVFGSMN